MEKWPFLTKSISNSKLFSTNTGSLTLLITYMSKRTQSVFKYFNKCIKTRFGETGFVFIAIGAHRGPKTLHLIVTETRNLVYTFECHLECDFPSFREMVGVEVIF